MPVTHCVTGMLICLFTCSVIAHSGHKDEPGQVPQVLAPGYQALTFEASPAGSYQLPVLGSAANGDILDMQGQAVTLHSLMGDKYVVLSFIYTLCDDVNGCPLATYVSSQVQNRLVDEPRLQDRVRFVSMSFDPRHDTPAVMRQYGENFTRPGFDWQFVTTSSEQALDPILRNYDQSILRDVDAKGEPAGTISHILRVFLIDPDKRIRNIYSTSFLHADTVVNDILTLEHQAAQTVHPAPGKINDSTAGLHGAGDVREGYEKTDYRSRTLSLQARSGQATDLPRLARTPPLGLPPLPAPVIANITAGKVQLGRQLFFDRRLSHNNTFSCAMCHIPEQGFGSHELATAVGIEGRTVRRNAPTIYNVAYNRLLFHDGRENRLEQQIWGPLLAHNEMANPSVAQVVDKINGIAGYRQQFRTLYGGQNAGMSNIGDAIASYERTLLSANSAFDRWYFAGEKNALAGEALAGFRLFSGKAHCSTCHRIEKDHALFTDHARHNTGIGFRNSMAPTPSTTRVQLAPGTWLDVETAAIADSAEPKPNDLGYYEITGDPEDRWKYRTPGLRNIALTAPYMHDGSISTLREVVEFYNAGGIPNELLDPILQPLRLSAMEIDQIVAFLENLTGDNVDILISDAFAAPIGNQE